MTRFLSESLQAPEPFFRSGLKRLEAANGHPNTDIRISLEVARATQTKLKQLGLDPQDTTAEELYHVLQERVKADDAHMVKKLRSLAALHVSADGEVVAGMIHAVKQLPESKRCFALKASSFRSMIKRFPPKKAMKLLGYRSMASFLKHENPISILAAAKLSESSHWQQQLLDQYKKLEVRDFEDRNITLLQPDSQHWQELAKNIVDSEKHNLICLKELGALVFLPLSHEVPAGTVTASLCLALHELNEIRATSSYLKLCQVRPDFGNLVQTVVSKEPRLNSRALDMPVPWHLIQRYYARLKQFGTDFDEPHVQLEDMTWHSIERALASIEPSFAFWLDSAHLGLLHDKKPVSLNVLDAALNCCNELPFERRIVHYFQRSLWHELLLRYLQHDSIRQTVRQELQPHLAEETVVS